jgi:hypothetical protein
MHEIRATVPPDCVREAARLAHAAGITRVTVAEVFVHGPDAERRVVSVETSTPKARAFVEAFLDSPTFSQTDCTRAPKITMAAPITNPIFWSDLEKRFRDLRNEYGDRLTAHWISSAWGEDCEQWCLRGAQGRESERFRPLAERAAVGLGHPAGRGALFFWLDLLKSESANYRPGYGGHDGDGNVWHAGVIRKLCEASADQCFRHETRLRVPQSVLGGEPNKQGIENTAEGFEQTEGATQEESADTSRQTRANDWQEVKISFFNERSAQITIGDTKHIREFGELGMADGRTGNPTLAWQMLHALAAANGVLDRPTPENPDWKTVEKRMQELRAWLRERSAISTDPLP